MLGPARAAGETRRRGGPGSQCVLAFLPRSCAHTCPLLACSQLKRIEVVPEQSYIYSRSRPSDD
jgi:hypothetical protein